MNLIKLQEDGFLTSCVQWAVTFMGVPANLKRLAFIEEQLICAYAAAVTPA